MAKGGFPRGMGGGGMMRQQAQMQQKILKMQKEIEAAQQKVEETLFTASVGGGAVKAVCSGKKELTELHISPDVLSPGGRGGGAGHGPLRRQRGAAPGRRRHDQDHGRHRRRAEPGSLRALTRNKARGVGPENRPRAPFFRGSFKSVPMRRPKAEAGGVRRAAPGADISRQRIHTSNRRVPR